jgi:hypothetical protein
MIKQINVTNQLGQELELELASPEKSGLAVLEVSGIGPPKADINLTEILSIAGSAYNSARVLYRNVIFKLRFLEHPTIEDTRLLAYKHFPIQQPVTLSFRTDRRDCTIVGYIEQNDPNIFSNEEGTVVSVICPNPYFVSKEKQQTMFSGNAKNFSFPFSNESLTQKLISFGAVFQNETALIVYEGDATVGVMINVHILGNVTNLKIYNSTTRDLMMIDSAKLSVMVGSGLQEGDDLEINTNKGFKSVVLIREGVRHNIINTLGQSITWLSIIPGDNIIGYTADVNPQFVQMSITNNILFDGV